MANERVRYQHISERERHKIEGFVDAGWGVREIARTLGRSVSSISDELHRHPGNGGGYSARLAEKDAAAIRAAANNSVHGKLPAGSRLARRVEAKLRRYESPEQIAGTLKSLRRKQTVSHETIYRFIFKDRPDLTVFLRSRKGKYRRRRGTAKRQVDRIQQTKRSIADRPAVIEERRELGHWEGDTVLGAEKTVRILTHVERKSGFLYMEKLDVTSAELVGRKTVRRFMKLPKRLRRSVTYDNGVEFADHQTTERDTKMTVYFARPYHSWERGTNENTNGLIRQFFPKKMPLRDVTQKELDRVAKLLNTRPRKRHGYRTPEDMLRQGVRLRSRI